MAAVHYSTGLFGPQPIPAKASLAIDVNAVGLQLFGVFLEPAVGIDTSINGCTAPSSARPWNILVVVAVSPLSVEPAASVVNSL